MKKYLLISILTLCSMVFIVPIPAWAVDGAGSGGANTGNMCVSSQTYSGALSSDGSNAATIGSAIVTSVFTSINQIMNDVAQQFYTGIVGTSGFQNVVSAGVVLYLAIYGAMIMFNLAQVNGREAIMRLMKIGIVYALIGNGTAGWQFFNTYVGNLFLGGMNELIANFSATGISGGSGSTVFGGNISSMTLDPNAMTMLFDPMGKIFATKFIASVLALFTTCGWGWFVAIILLFGLLEFVFMLIGALMTYVKSIIGLCFLFGIAPLFVAFIMFEKTRQIFIGWLNQVISFALTPVMLFAFLSFYITLIDSTITRMIFPTAQPFDICWANWFSVGTFDLHVPKITVNGQVIGGECTGGTPSISLIDALYFAVLCYLGKSFSDVVEQIARDLSGGIGPGSSNMGSPTSMLMKSVSERFGGGGGAARAADTARTPIRDGRRDQG